MCLSTCIHKLYGVTFINSRGLRTVGEKIENCMFTEDLSSIFPNTYFRIIFDIKSEFNNNIVYGLSNSIIIADPKISFKGNLFYGLKNCEISHIIFENLNHFASS